MQLQEAINFHHPARPGSAMDGVAILPLAYKQFGFLVQVSHLFSLLCLMVKMATPKKGIVDRIILKFKLISPIANINPNKIPKHPIPI